MLAVKGRLARFALERFLLQVLAVIAQVAAGDPALGFNDLVANAIEKSAVVADHHQGHIDLGEVALQPLNRGHVEVVGGLIEQQQIGLLQQDLAQGNPHLPAA